MAWNNIYYSPQGRDILLSFCIPNDHSIRRLSTDLVKMHHGDYTYVCDHEIGAADVGVTEK